MISVLMPVYNSENFLEESIKSILNQSYTNFEFLIYDDNSTDNSKAIIKKFKQQDSRIKFFFNNKNNGYAKLLNKMIFDAKYNFLARMDSDDISEKTRLEKQLNFLLQNPKVSIVGSFIEIIDKKGNFVRKSKYPINYLEIKSALRDYCAFSHPTTMLRADFVKKLGGYRTNMEPVEDYDLWTRLAQVSTMHNLPEYLLKYRLHIDSVSFTRSNDQFLKTEIVRKNYQNLLNGGDDIIGNFNFKSTNKDKLIKNFPFLKKIVDTGDYHNLSVLFKNKVYILFGYKFILFFFKKPFFLIRKILYYAKKNLYNIILK
jgi:glycosyltransferase involved in cell wall biosynthesis